MTDSWNRVEICGTGQGEAFKAKCVADNFARFDNELLQGLGIDYDPVDGASKRDVEMQCMLIQNNSAFINKCNGMFCEGDETKCHPTYSDLSENLLQGFVAPRRYTGSRAQVYRYGAPTTATTTETAPATATTTETAPATATTTETAPVTATPTVTVANNNVTAAPTLANYQSMFMSATFSGQPPNRGMAPSTGANMSAWDTGYLSGWTKRDNSCALDLQAFQSGISTEYNKRIEEIFEKDTTIFNLNQEKSGFQSQIASLTGDLKSMTESKSQLQNECDAAAATALDQIKSITAARGELQTQYEQLDSKCTTNIGDLESQLLEITKGRESIQTKYDTDVADLNSKITNLNSQVTTFEQQVAQLTSSKDELEKKCAADATAASTALLDLEKKCTNDAATASTAFSNLEAKCSEESTAFKSQIEELKAQIASLTDAKSASESEVKRLTSELKTAVSDKNKCLGNEIPYGERGELYQGKQTMTRSGKKCLPWKSGQGKAGYQAWLNNGIKPEENFCRNPGGSSDSIWCFVDNNGKATQEMCDPMTFIS